MTCKFSEFDGDFLRILLITYFFPPYNSVGAVRPGKLAAFLHAKGHAVHVLTAKNQPFPLGAKLELPATQVTYADGWSINAPVELLMGGRRKVAHTGFGVGLNPNSLKQRLGRLYKTLLHWPDGQIGWVGSAIKAGRHLLQTQKFDLIYVSAPSFSGCRVARSLSAISGTPWIAEFRDLWTDNHDFQYPEWRLSIEKKWEYRLLATAGALVTVSPPLIEKLKRFKLPTWEIRNGFDPSDYVNLPDVTRIYKNGNDLNITFTGNLYPGHYDLAVFCEGLSRFLALGGKALVHIAGRNVDALLEQARKSGVADLFICHQTVARPVALAMQKASDVLLTFLWDHGNQEGIYSTKLFEYAGCSRPILAIGRPDSDVGVLLTAAAIGSACGTAETVAEKLLGWHTEKSLNGSLSTAPTIGFDFTRGAQFSKLESHLTAFVQTQSSG